MLTTMRQIGNSKGVLIPAAFLASCRIENDVDMQLKDGQIIITPVVSKPRAGWFDAPVEAYASSKADAQVEMQAAQDWSNPNLTDDSEWVW